RGLGARSGRHRAAGAVRMAVAVAERAPGPAATPALPVIPGLDDLPALLEHRGHPAETVLGLAFRLWSPPMAAGGTPAGPAAALPECPAPGRLLPAVCAGSIALQVRRDWLRGMG